MKLAGTRFPARPAPTPRRSKVLRQGLRGFGYIENQNIMIEYRYADGNPDRPPRLVTELIDLNVDVLAAQHSASADQVHTLLALRPLSVNVGRTKIVTASP